MEGGHRQSQVAQLLGGQVGVRHSGGEVEKHHPRHGLACLGAHQVKGEGKAPPLEGDPGLYRGVDGLPGKGVLLPADHVELQGVRLGRRAAVFLLQQQAEGLLPGIVGKARQVLGDFHGGTTPFGVGR